LHRLGDDLADLGVGISRYAANLCNRFIVFAGLRQHLELSNDRDGCFVDAALQIHRVHTRSDGF
jgi:hypothetical protein